LAIQDSSVQGFDANLIGGSKDFFLFFLCVMIITLIVITICFGVTSYLYAQ